MLFNSWMLYTAFKCGWGPQKNGQSLAGYQHHVRIGAGRIAGAIAKRFSSQRLVVIAPIIVSPLLDLASYLLIDDWRIGAPFYCGRRC